MNMTTIWLIVFVACVAIEIVTMGLTTIWFAGGSLMAAVVSAIGAPLWLQLIRCMVFVTSMEFITGIIVNKWLHLQVWDYSRLPLQLFGQICVPFIIIFSGLAAVGIVLSGYLMHWLYQEPKPHYYIL